MKACGRLAFGALALIVLASCSRADPSIIARPPAVEPANGAVEAQTLEVAAAESGLAFKQTELTAQAGQPLRVSFTNPQPLEHNWVLAEPDQAEALASTGKDKDDAAEGMIAASDTIANGTSDTVEVPALEVASYTYLCTVPGHYEAGMQGTLTLTAGP
jgi:uncharacterized cupredoxin-like copper-binding protein